MGIAEIALATGIVNAIGSVFGASDKTITLAQKLWPKVEAPQDGILVKIVKDRHEGVMQREAVDAMVKLYETLGAAERYAVRERRSQAATFVRTRVARFLAVSSISTIAGYILSGDENLSLVQIIGFVAVQFAVSFFWARGRSNPGDVGSNNSVDSTSHEELWDLSNRLERTAKEAAARLGVHTDLEDPEDPGPSPGNSSSALSQPFVVAYDKLAASVRSIELHALGQELIEVALHVETYLSSSVDDVIVQSLATLVRTGKLKPFVQGQPLDTSVQEQRTELSSCFSELGLSDRLDHPQYSPIWRLDLAAMLQQEEGEEHLRRKLGAVKWAPTFKMMS